MARIRSIKPDFFLDDELGALPALARLLFAGLWCQADGEGRLEDRPRRLKVEILPYDDCDFEALLEQLNAGGFIQRYEVDGERFIQVTNFKRHQRISGDEASTPSRFPAPPARTKQPRNSQEASTKQSRSDDEGPVALEGKGREGKGKEEDLAGSLPADPPPSPVVASLPCVGKGPKEYAVTEAKVAEWREAYPGVDVLSELRKAKQWLTDNPSRRKTHTGSPAFVSRWLTKAQDRCPRQPGATDPAKRPREPSWDPSWGDPYAEPEAADASAQSQVP